MVVVRIDCSDVDDAAASKRSMPPVKMGTLEVPGQRESTASTRSPKGSPRTSPRKNSHSVSPRATPRTPRTELSGTPPPSSRGGSEGEQTAGARRKSLNERKLFSDVEKLKSTVKDHLTKPQYNVSQFYWERGFFRSLATNAYFENMTLAVISFNALWIAIDTDLNDSAVLLDAHPVFQIADHGFCVYFTVEWFVRYMAFKRKRDGLKDAWFVFDTALVGMMVLETWVLTLYMLASGGGGGESPLGNAGMLRMLRLLRLSRLARMLRSMPELMILIKGMVAASRSVFFTMCLLLIVIYIFAIMLTQLTSGTEAGGLYFESITRSMYVLLMHGTFLDNLGPVAMDIYKSGTVYAVIFYIFISMAALMVMNMLIGVLCEVVSAVAATEKEEMTVAFVKQKLEEVILEIDENSDMIVQKDEFLQIISSPQAVVALNDVDVDACCLVDFADVLFPPDEDGEECGLDFEEFMEAVLQLRGSNQATVKDVMHLTKVVRNEATALENRLGLEPRKLRYSTVEKDSDGATPDNLKTGASANSVAKSTGSAACSSDDDYSSPCSGTTMLKEGGMASPPPIPPSPVAPMSPQSPNDWTSENSPGLKKDRGLARVVHKANSSGHLCVCGRPYKEQVQDLPGTPQRSGSPPPWQKADLCRDCAAKLDGMTAQAIASRKIEPRMHSPPRATQPAPVPTPYFEETHHADESAGGSFHKDRHHLEATPDLKNLERFLSAAQEELQVLRRRTSQHAGMEDEASGCRSRAWAMKMHDVVSQALIEINKYRPNASGRPHTAPAPLTLS
eukprot:TRINITY_DN3201_c0_g1_i1.p1 TRINITY_DN3201_c0_g1~~TRINITY_DN3201_c0_g1_i1.p1  ORF type:complete len:790 (-),score=192.92 TRINITY_DN3201_c0_g1_i1:89-2458(-)